MTQEAVRNDGRVARWLKRHGWKIGDFGRREKETFVQNDRARTDSRRARDADPGAEQRAHDAARNPDADSGIPS